MRNIIGAPWSRREGAEDQIHPGERKSSSKYALKKRRSHAFVSEQILPEPGEKSPRKLFAARFVERLDLENSSTNLIREYFVKTLREMLVELH